MRVLSRRRKFAKAVACGYSEGAGFACSNGTLLLLPAALCSTRGRPVDLAMASCVQDPRVSCALGCASWGHRLSPVPVGSPLAGGRARCDVGAAAATRRWRRGGVQGAQRPCTRLWTTLSSARHVPPPTSSREAGAATASGAGRRLLPTTKTSAPPARATSRLLPFSHRGRQWHCLWRTRRHKQHGCGEDCSRSASLAALSTTAGAALTAKPMPAPPA